MVFSFIASIHLVYPAEDMSCWQAERGMLRLIRLSRLRNTPVICGEQQIGLFQSACFDRMRKRVCAFVISSGLYGKRIVPSAHIRMIGNGFVLIDGWCRYRRMDDMQTSLFVRDTTGLLVGRINDYAMDQESLEILAIEVFSGYLQKERRRKAWMYAYSFSADSDAWIIPAVLQDRLCFSKEGNRVCECPQ